MKKLRMVSAAALLIFTVLVGTSCGSKSGQQNESATEETVNASLEVDSLLANADALASQEITVEGVCTHICKHGGAKIFLMGSDDKQTIRIEAGEVGKFKQECVNSIVKVKGKLVEQRIDEAYLQQWEEKVKASTAEKHGDSAAGCSTEKQARGETNVNTAEERIEGFRQRIADRKAKEGKEYLSFYFVEATEYEIL